MIDKININQIQDPFDGKGQPNRPKAVANNKADATLQIDNAALIEQALESQPTDANAVQKAIKLIESGQLDNPANIKEAAANIIKFGI